MREHGVNLPDPQTGSGGEVMIGGPGSDFDPSSPVFQQASQACQGLLPAGPPAGGPDTEALKSALLSFSRCMRDQGLAFPDLQVDSAGRVVLGDPNIDTSDPKFVAAQGTCQHILTDLDSEGSSQQP